MSRGRFMCTYCRQDHPNYCVNVACPVGYHNVKSQRPEEIDDEDHTDPIEVLETRGYQLGFVSAKEAIAPRLRSQAGDLFASGRDDEARLLRDLAKKFEDEARKARTEYHERFPR